MQLQRAYAPLRENSLHATGSWGWELHPAASGDVSHNQFTFFLIPKCFKVVFST